MVKPARRFPIARALVTRTAGEELLNLRVERPVDVRVDLRVDVRGQIRSGLRTLRTDAEEIVWDIPLQDHWLGSMARVIGDPLAEDGRRKASGTHLGDCMPLERGRGSH